MHFLRKLVSRSKALRRHVVNAALFAVLLNAMAPSVTAMLAASEGRRVSMTAHCLAMAVESSQQAPAQPGSPDKDKGASCPFCFAHAGSFALAPVIHAPQMPSVGAYLPAAAYVAVLPALHTWLNSKPRGPPALS
jgi:hypothetical protein